MFDCPPNIYAGWLHTKVVHWFEWRMWLGFSDRNSEWYAGNKKSATVELILGMTGIALELDC